jgi:hypothetical protein
MGISQETLEHEELQTYHNTKLLGRCRSAAIAGNAIVTKPDRNALIAPLKLTQLMMMAVFPPDGAAPDELACVCATLAARPGRCWLPGGFGSDRILDRTVDETGAISSSMVEDQVARGEYDTAA